ncbi:YaiI/YqxD family protein [Staphylococcus durrellii]|uniref:YaiI/YqxD family protein n=1 Tax=Staphylococcus durrellii TaxID=2781773 RepID=UPI00189FD1FC|nr:YaiI/YqxD family protein [Staphylococcus durrellii]MBF7017698.1 YaiI/YqxD family protein [Staphylococcus durrellii]
MTRIIIDGDACPVTHSVIELTTGTGIFVIVVRSFSHYSTTIQPEHVRTVYVDNNPEAVDYKIVQLSNSEDIVITQDYGLASLLLNKVAMVLHHSGRIYTNDNIDTLLAQRHANAQFRKSGGRTKGPSKFTADDQSQFETILTQILNDYIDEEQ